jgi:hypothetical protein
METMKIDLSDEDQKLIVEALEHFYAYTRAAKRDDSRYQELADRLKVQAAIGETQPKVSQKKKR